MHGCSLKSALLVNAEVDSMGGVVDGGVGVGIETSPRQAAIEKAQAELRQEYDVREERRRELEFLEKGGNPLDFKFGNAATVSVQSTSLTDQHPQHEAKGSFVLTGSPRGDSVESSGRPEAHTVCEPNSADNLLLFDGESEFVEVERNSLHPNRSNIFPSEQFSQLDGSQNAKESGDSAALGIPKKAYRRRNRSRPNRDAARSSSTDIVPSPCGHISYLPSCHGSKNAKEAESDTGNHKNQKISSNGSLKPISPNVSAVLKAAPSTSQLNMELEGEQAVVSITELTKNSLPEAVSGCDASKSLSNKQHNQHSQVDTRKTSSCVPSDIPDTVGFGEREQIVEASLECPPCVAAKKVENRASSGQPNGFSSAKGNRENIPNVGQNISAAPSPNGLDSKSYCTKASLDLAGNKDSDLCTNLMNIDSNGTTKEQTVLFEGTPNKEGDEMLKVKNKMEADDSCAFINDDHNSLQRSHQGNDSMHKAEEELHGSGSILQNGLKDTTSDERMEPNGHTTTETERKPGDLLGDSSNPQMKNVCTVRPQGAMDSSIFELPETTLSFGGSTVPPEQQASTGIHFKLASKADEDSILEEARIIEAKRKRIAELSVGTLPLENHHKSYWDIVLEEMAWLANDFAQERLWKITAAAQICHRVAFTYRLRFEEQNLVWKQKKVAHTLAKAIMEFWHSAEETSNEMELQCSEKKVALAVEGYAMRYLKYNNSSLVLHGQAEAPVTPDRISDLGVHEVSWEDHFTEENLFYTVPTDAMETYRKSIESHLAQCEKTGSSMQEEVETSIYDAVADSGSQENAYEEDEGETSTYFMPGVFEVSKSSKFEQKKRKNLKNSYAARSYELGADLPFMRCMENKVGTQQSVLMGKRPSNRPNVGSIPTKRVRTASRQRVLSPFSAGTSGCFQAPNKTDASSGDTNSFQDDQSTFNGGYQIQHSLEVDSVEAFEKQFPFDSAEVSTKPKKKKAAKHLGSPYEHRWQLDSRFQNEERDRSIKRLESDKLESNGSSGLSGQHIVKKPKMMKQSLDNSFDNPTPMAASIPSPVASQMSNMSIPNKFVKMLGGRDRGRKAKTLKTLAGQAGSGSPWSQFEDKALVVLVHDMGPNWELVSDAINNALQFKRIFRKPIDCKERHKTLMDMTSSNGADSAEDSGSSHPYPSTLPGIPKGSARQLFQRLQGPMEEDTLKCHFEKIIEIGQKQHYRRIQNHNQDIKQIQPHNSHALALSQVCPNNLNGPPLTPLDLCNAIVSSPDAHSLGHQGSHTSGLVMSNQGTVTSMLPPPGSNSSLQGSSNMVLGNNYSSPLSPLNASARDGRYGVPRTAFISDEQQRMQHYNQILSGRSIQQSSLSVSGALPGTDRSIRKLPGGNGMSIMGGVTRSMAMVRPGLQGIASSSMLNSGNMLSSSTVPMANPANMQAGVGPVQGNSMLRPRDALHMMRNPEHQRQMMVPEVQTQVTQGNSQGIPPFGGLSSGYANQTAPPPVKKYPLHQHQQHQMSPQQSHVLSNSHHPHLRRPNNSHQAYARHQQQQRFLQQQQQQQFAASNALMPLVQAQSQLPISSSLQNSSQIQSQTSSSPVSLSHLTPSSSVTPMSQHQQKHHTPPHGLSRNPQTGGSGLTNQMGKQRQHQPQHQQQFQQSGRHHPQQRQQLQSQQQAKLLKGVGRGNMLMHQNPSLDSSLLNGLSMTTGSQSAEKGEKVMHLMHGQGLYSESGLDSVQPSKQVVPPHSSNDLQLQQNMYSGQTIPSSVQLQQLPFHSDNGNQGIPPVTSGPTLSALDQAVSPSVMASSKHQQLQLQQQSEAHQKLVNHTQPAAQRVLQQNHRVNSDPLSKLRADQAGADQQSPVVSSQMGNATTMPLACVDTTNVIPDVSSVSTPQCNALEPMPPVGQGLGQKQSSGSLAPLGRNVCSQQQQSQLQQPPTPPPPPPQQLQQQSPQQISAAEAASASRERKFIYQTH